MSFLNKVVVVTGAASGIGATAASLFAKEGAKVALADINADRLKNVAEECNKTGEKALVIKADVSKDSEAENIINQTVENFGKLDVLVNNAGIFKTTRILDKNIMDIYDKLMATNLRAIVHLTSLSAPYLMKTRGNIVNISAMGSIIIPRIDFVSYTVSKAGLNHFTKGAALELAPHGVRVNCITAGPVRTNLMKDSGLSASWDDFKSVTALDRVSEPEEIADLILYLASDKSKGITGSNFVTDNGYLIKK